VITSADAFVVGTILSYSLAAGKKNFASFAGLTQFERLTMSLRPVLRSVNLNSVVDKNGLTGLTGRVT
jgi:hypothetical protein